MIAPKDRLIVALDVPRVADAQALVERLDDAVGVYKIGLELLFVGGGAFARGLVAAGKRVFFDAKLQDIGNTVERATANIAELGATFLTVHGTDRKTLDAAVRGRGGSELKLLAVTVLTNLTEDDLEEQGIHMSPARLVARRAWLAAEAGFDGVVASGQEAARIRDELGPDALIVTPGIRLTEDAEGDQARVMTPARAIGDGADYLVVGRPITQAEDPRAAAEAFVAEIAAQA
ncbi:MAG: orotidine-5'-phosphate decarboxylase [Hyphomicrobiales bacterium]|nr:orotidine-5'-phosphate decarboxylase [Hyphomicrobiales bacterium]